MLSIFQDRETPLMGSVVVLGDSVSLSPLDLLPCAVHCRNSIFDSSFVGLIRWYPASLSQCPTFLCALDVGHFDKGELWPFSFLF